MKRAAAFLDTPVFLHYRPITEIPWEKMLPAGEIDLVIAPVVLKELDEHKYSHHSRRVQRRAASELKKLDKLSEQGTRVVLKPGVWTSFIGTEPLLDFEENGLSRSSQD